MKCSSPPGSSPRGLSRPARRVLPFCVLAFLATMWPIYPLFSSIEPRVLGMPFSLVYLVIILVVVFVVMVGLFLWEDRNGRLGD